LKYNKNIVVVTR